jgi:SnoaL-like domain/Aspartyl protease
MWTRHFASGLLALACFTVAPSVSGQGVPPAESATITSEEIPIERCDLLPMVKVRVGPKEMRFLVDTAATSMLNLKSFSGGGTKEIRVTSWSGTAATSAREVTIDEFSLGSHHLRNLKLPAIDLSPIGAACAGRVDGILGVDLLDKMAVTIDLRRRIASLGVETPDPKAVYADMEGSMHTCMSAFEQGKAAEFGECLDPEVVFYTPYGEFVGREQVLEYLRERYFRYAPDLHHRMKLHEMQVFGNAVWYSYEYTIDTPKEHLDGHGFAMCRRNGTRWRMLNLHNSLVEASAKNAKP